MIRTAFLALAVMAASLGLVSFPFESGLPAFSPLDLVRGQQQGKQETVPRFEELHRLIRPGAGESPWITSGIAWMRSLSQGRAKAAAEGKPLFIYGVDGAGFRDPLGFC